MPTGVPTTATASPPHLLVVLAIFLPAAALTQCGGGPTKVVFVPGAESHGYAGAGFSRPTQNDPMTSEVVSE